MRIKRTAAWSLAAVLLCSCQLNTSYEILETDEETEASSAESTQAQTDQAETESQTETATEEIITLPDDVISKIASDTETQGEPDGERIPDMVLPTDEAGEWEDYILNVNEDYTEFWDPATNEELGEFGVTFTVHDFPVIYSLHDSAQEKAINDTLTAYVNNDYRHRFQMKDLKLEMNCTAKHTTGRFVSYILEGKIYHVGDDSRYLDEKEYMYFFTIDRMTGSIIDADMAFGLANVIKAIEDGRYSVVRSGEDTFEAFSDRLLAQTYKNDPLFTDDVFHVRDFYFDDDGKMCVCIWVGVEHGSYCILKLNATPQLILSKDRSIEPEETAPEDTAEDTSAEPSGDGETSEDQSEETSEGEGEETSEDMSEETTEGAVEKYTHDDLPDATNAAGEWEDFILTANPVFREFWDPATNPELGANGVIFECGNAPVIYCLHDPELERAMNEMLLERLRNDYIHRFQMKDLKLSMNSSPKNAGRRYISFVVSGNIYHTGGDERYRDGQEYMYFFTVDRMTGYAVKAEDVYGVDRIKKDIEAGNYTRIRESDEAVKAFSDRLLAKTYINDPLFSDDADHELDFYIDDDGKVCVCIWVGERNGSYCILKLEGEPRV